MDAPRWNPGLVLGISAAGWGRGDDPGQSGLRQPRGYCFDPRSDGDFYTITLADARWSDPNPDIDTVGAHGDADLDSGGSDQYPGSDRHARANGHSAARTDAAAANIGADGNSSTGGNANAAADGRPTNTDSSAGDEHTGFDGDADPVAKSDGDATLMKKG